jgi:hypothetical protein
MSCKFDNSILQQWLEEKYVDKGFIFSVKIGNFHYEYKDGF